MSAKVDTRSLRIFARTIFGFAQNPQGDNNTIPVHQGMNAHFDEIKSILSDKGYEAEAKELETKRVDLG